MVPKPGDLAGVFRHLKTYAHVRLGCQVVDLFGLHVIDDIQQGLPDGDIPIMQVKVNLSSAQVGIAVNMVDPAGVEGARPRIRP